MSFGTDLSISLDDFLNPYFDPIVFVDEQLSAIDAVDTVRITGGEYLSEDKQGVNDVRDAAQRTGCDPSDTVVLIKPDVIITQVENMIHEITTIRNDLAKEIDECAVKCDQLATEYSSESGPALENIERLQSETKRMIATINLSAENTTRRADRLERLHLESIAAKEALQIGEFFLQFNSPDPTINHPDVFLPQNIHENASMLRHIHRISQRFSADTVQTAKSNIEDMFNTVREHLFGQLLPTLDLANAPDVRDLVSVITEIGVPTEDTITRFVSHRITHFARTSLEGYAKKAADENSIREQLENAFAYIEDFFEKQIELIKGAFPDFANDVFKALLQRILAEFNDSFVETYYIEASKLMAAADNQKREKFSSYRCASPFLWVNGLYHIYTGTTGLLTILCEKINALDPSSLIEPTFANYRENYPQQEANAFNKYFARILNRPAYFICESYPQINEVIYNGSSSRFPFFKPKFIESLGTAKQHPVLVDTEAVHSGTSIPQMISTTVNLSSSLMPSQAPTPTIPGHFTPQTPMSMASMGGPDRVDSIRGARTTNNTPRSSRTYKDGGYDALHTPSPSTPRTLNEAKEGKAQLRGRSGLKATEVDYDDENSERSDDDMDSLPDSATPTSIFEDLSQFNFYDEAMEMSPTTVPPTLFAHCLDILQDCISRCSVLCFRQKRMENLKVFFEIAIAWCVLSCDDSIKFTRSELEKIDRPTEEAAKANVFNRSKKEKDEEAIRQQMIDERILAAQQFRYVPNIIQIIEMLKMVWNHRITILVQHQPNDHRALKKHLRSQLILIEKDIQKDLTQFINVTLSTFTARTTQARKKNDYMIDASEDRESAFLARGPPLDDIPTDACQAGISWIRTQYTRISQFITGENVSQVFVAIALKVCDLVDENLLEQKITIQGGLRVARDISEYLIFFEKLHNEAVSEQLDKLRRICAIFSIDKKSLKSFIEGTEESGISKALIMTHLKCRTDYQSIKTDKELDLGIVD
ncbi:putative Exocyst complex component Sec10 [Blattamonas nauphoetae]|uniref:Exocyst complex component Sec10 n=1 Tax=Blattamonas nauphoetae TaxID=2049346 RepID=A0ABQ9XVW6_9EUKA|nr:putative Exocyst complex component Sec10 [Blattamonas nauphoetae]